MRLPNGYGSVVKMSGKRRKPYMVRKTIGWHLDETKGRQIQDFQIIGYAETRAEGLRMLAEYNQNFHDGRCRGCSYHSKEDCRSFRRYEPDRARVHPLGHSDAH